MMHRVLLLALALAVGASGADARPLPQRGGQQHSTEIFTPPPTGGAQACDLVGSSVCATYKDGQTFVTWNDMASGVSGRSWKYKVVRSTSPINSGNYAAATEIASFITNNSGQLFGGDPNNIGASYWNQNYRINLSSAGAPAGPYPMAVIPDINTGTRTLPLWSGLQVHTALAAEDGYYAVIGVSGGADTYIGSVGPIAESVAPTEGIKIADSLSRGQNYGKIIEADQAHTNLPIVLRAHGSAFNTGCNTLDCQYGDVWQHWMTPEASTWNEGRPEMWVVLRDNAGHSASLPASLEVSHWDDIMNPLDTGPMETWHVGIGMSPHPNVGPANRKYFNTANAYARMLNWTVRHYGADPNAIHMTGLSLGAIGGALGGMRLTSPKLASVTMQNPMWRLSTVHLAGRWPGDTWSSGMPFKATNVGGVATVAPQTLGTNPEAVMTETGERWGGDGGFADMPGFIASNPGNDLPFATWQTTKNDLNGTWLEHLTTSDAFQSAHRGYAMVWTLGLHDTGFDTMGVVSCDRGNVVISLCYPKTKFRLDTPYIAFSNSSIDDNLGTATPMANGIFDGDYTGGKNIGFTWNVTSDASHSFNFTVGNNFMNRAATVHPSTTLAATMPSTGAGSVDVAAGTGSLFGPISGTRNKYFIVNGTEAILVLSRSGDTLNYSTRGLFNSTASAHSAGETIQQVTSQPTGPNIGPQATMTADLTPRRVQNFKPTNGTIVSCNVTPNGGSLTPVTATVANGIFTLPAVTINATGVTSVACAY